MHLHPAHFLLLSEKTEALVTFFRPEEDTQQHDMLAGSLASFYFCFQSLASHAAHAVCARRWTFANMALTGQTAGQRPLLAALKQEVHQGDRSPQQQLEHVCRRCHSRRGLPPGDDEKSKHTNQREQRQEIQMRLPIGCRGLYLIK